MTAQEQAAMLFPIFVAWQERKRREDAKRVTSILSAWGILAKA